jgi:FAD synthase
VEFYAFLRGEEKFESFSALSEQIHRDAEAAKAWFANEKLASTNG